MIKKAYLKSFAKSVIKGLLGLLAIIIIFETALYFFLKYDPEKFAASRLAEISRTTGLSFTFGAVDVDLFPWPTLSVSDLAIVGKDLDFSCAWISARPDFIKIFTGDFFPAAIKFQRPRLTLKTDINLNDFSAVRNKIKQIQKDFQKDREDAEKTAYSCALDISQGQLKISGSDDSLMTLKDFSCDLNLVNSQIISGDINASTLVSSRAKKLVYGVDKVQISGAIQLDDFFTGANNVRGSAVAHGLKFAEEMTLQFSWESSPKTGTADFDFSADVKSLAEKASLGGSVSKMPHGLRLNNVDWRLGADSGIINATLNYEDTPLLIEGVFFARRLSLPQWLGFGRVLPAGLQLSLDNIFNIYTDFKIDEKELKATRIEAVCVGTELRGTGEISDWKKPVATLNMKARNLKLDTAFGEMAGKDLEKPAYANPPLVPFSNKSAPDDPPWDYVINLNFDNVKLTSLTAENATITIKPGDLDANGQRDVILSGDLELYKGKMAGKCYFGAPDPTPLRFSSTFANLDGAALAKSLKNFPLKAGYIKGELQCESIGDTLQNFFSNLKGKISLNCENATFATGLDAQKIASSIQIHKSRFSSGQIEINADINISFSMKDLSGNASMKGIMGFNKKGMEINNGRLNFSLKPGLPFAKGETLTGEGSLNIKTSANSYKLEKASISFLGQRFTASFQTDATKKTYKGRLALTDGNLAKLPESLGLKNMPAALSKMAFTTDLSGNTNQINFTNFKGHLGETRFDGTLDWRLSDEYLRTKLNFDQVNLENLFPASKKSANKKLDFSGMKHFTGEGEFKFGVIKGWNGEGKNAKISLKMAKGVLNILQAEEIVYGAPLRCSGEIRFGQGLNFNIKADIRSFDLGQAARERKISGELKGRSSLTLNLKGYITDTSQFPAALKGDWSASILNGSWQSRNKNGKLTGKPTIFESVKANGALDNGIISSSSLRMIGPRLRATGKGEINLVRKKIDCNFEIDMKGLPNFPLYIYGSLNDPKTRVGAGKLILNALGGITQGIGSLFGGIGKGIISIFQ